MFGNQFKRDTVLIIELPRCLDQRALHSFNVQEKKAIERQTFATSFKGQA